MTPTTETKAKAREPEVLAELGKLDAAVAAIEARREELGTELAEKREILDGPMYDRNLPGAVERLRALHVDHPEQFLDLWPGEGRRTPGNMSESQAFAVSRALAWLTTKGETQPPTGHPFDRGS